MDFCKVLRTMPGTEQVLAAIRHSAGTAVLWEWTPENVNVSEVHFGSI